MGEAGIRVRFFIDEEKAGTTVEGIDVIGVDELVGTEIGHIAMGIHNPVTDVKAIANQLMQRGAQYVFSPVECSVALARQGLALDSYWLTGRVETLATYEARREQLIAILDDAESEKTFYEILRYRSNGDINQSPSTLPLSDQYFPDDLDFVLPEMRYVDAGAYDGDTVRQFKVRKIALGGLLAVEPDPRNFAGLVKEISDLDAGEVIAVPIGLSDRVELLRFSADGTAAAGVSSAGETMVQVADLDSLAGHWNPTHVKMDIEGAELNALVGMTSIIKRLRPRLAISVYHKPNDIWEIPLWMSELGVNYKMYIRNYGQQGFDTVLYCIPA